MKIFYVILLRVTFLVALCFCFSQVVGCVKHSNELAASKAVCK